MFGAINQKPAVSAEGRIQPIVRFGLKLMSIGFMVEESAAIVWRGPMLFKALDQFFRDVQWGDLDVLIIDLPPGTGDIQLSLAQKVPVTGALVVSTPQNLSLIDVKKAIDMFQRVNIPILGVIENMAYLENKENGEKIQLFPKGELDGYLDSKKIKKTAEMPFHPTVSLSSEMGVPVVESHPSSKESQIFLQIADGLVEQLHLNL
jgi:ATP-binding protein involved in chromosome partitioning